MNYRTMQQYFSNGEFAKILAASNLDRYIPSFAYERDERVLYLIAEERTVFDVKYTAYSAGADTKNKCQISTYSFTEYTTLPLSNGTLREALKHWAAQGLVQLK